MESETPGLAYWRSAASRPSTGLLFEAAVQPVNSLNALSRRPGVSGIPCPGIPDQCVPMSFMIWKPFTLG